MEPAAHLETPPKPIAPETAKLTPPAKTIEPTQAAPQSADQAHSARHTLEDIAKGTPVAEALAPKAETLPLPDSETITQTLAEANALLLDLRDMRLLVSSLATNAENTSLGMELKLDTLRMLGSMSNADLPNDAVIRLSDLQKKITAMNLPQKDPKTSALIPVLETYNSAHPEKALPQAVMESIASGQKDTAATIGHLLNSDPDLAGPVWKELTGIEGFTGLQNISGENVLKLAHIDPTPENQAKIHEMFDTIQRLPPRQQEAIMDKLIPTLMLGGFTLMFLINIGTGQGNSGH